SARQLDSVSVSIESTAAGTPVTVEEASSTSISLGNPNAGIGEIRGQVTLTGPGASVLVEDGWDTSDESYTIRGADLTSRAGAVAVHFGDNDSVRLELGSGTNTVTAAAPLPALPISLLAQAGGSGNTLIGPDINTSWHIEAASGQFSGSLGQVHFDG